MLIDIPLPVLLGGVDDPVIPPDAFPDLLVWLVADDNAPVGSGNDVDTWTDRTANAWRYVRSLSGTGPAYFENRWNGQGVIVFDGSSGTSLTVAASQTQPGFIEHTMAVAYRAAGTGGDGPVILGNPAGIFRRGWTASEQNAAAIALMNYDSPQVQLTIADPFDNTVDLSPYPRGHVAITRRNAAGEHDYFHDGVDRSVTPPPVQNTRNMVARRLAGLNEVDFCEPDTEIAELVVITSPITDEERAGLYNYFATKYGFPLVG